LSRIIQNLSFRYTRWVNRRYDRCGHLFQGRYKAVLVDGDSYLLELVRYIHLNPVRAGVVDSPIDYPWTGHKAYCGKETIPWLCTGMMLEMLSSRKSRAGCAYSEFVNEGINEGRRGDFHGEGSPDSRIFGEEEFVQNILGEGEVLPESITIGDVVSAVCGHYRIDSTMLAQPGKNRAMSRIRGVAAWVVQDLPSCSLTELARHCGRDISSLSAAAQRLHTLSVHEPSLLREKGEILEQITRYKA
jgi:hypothetical protein